MATDYSSITEVPGLRASKEQIARLYHRYFFAQDYIESKDILEVACGSGIGLGFLAQKARSVVGGDIDKKNVAIAYALYKDTPIMIEEIDAHNIHHDDHSFDVVLLFEAIYYLENPVKFIQEAKRLLRENGLLLICTVNKDWEDFHPSPFTHRYFSVPELFELLKKQFHSVDLYGAFPTKSNGFVELCVSLIKRMATRFHLIPGSLAARAYLKRIFFGPLQPLPAQIETDMSDYVPPIPLSPEKPTGDFKIIYAVAKK